MLSRFRVAIRTWAIRRTSKTNLEFRDEIVLGVTSWKVNRLLPLAEDMLEDLRAKIRVFETDHLSKASGAEIRAMLDRWKDMKPTQVELGKADMGETWRVAEGCDMGGAIEAYLVETYDEVANLVARNAIHAATVERLAHTERTLN